MTQKELLEGGHITFNLSLSTRAAGREQRSPRRSVETGFGLPALQIVDFLETPLN